MTARLETLRTLLHDLADGATWQRLMQLFEGWDGDDLRVGVDYAQEHLGRWDDALRVAPQRWVKHALGHDHRALGAFADGAFHPALPLTRHMVWDDPLGRYQRKKRAQRRFDHASLRSLERAEPWAQALTHVTVLTFRLTAKLVRQLAQSPNLHRGLRSLTLRTDGQTRCDPKHTRAWADTQPLERVERLALLRARLSFKALHPILRNAPRLDTLNVGYNPVGDALLMDLKRPYLTSPPPWRGLDLSGTNLSAEGLHDWLHHPSSASLRALVLRDGGWDSDTARTLGALTALPRPDLVHLDLSDNPISAPLLAALLEAPELASLRTLSLNRALIDDDACAPLLAARRAGRLDALEAYANRHVSARMRSDLHAAFRAGVHARERTRYIPPAARPHLPSHTNAAALTLDQDALHTMRDPHHDSLALIAHDLPPGLSIPPLSRRLVPD